MKRYICNILTIIISIWAIVVSLPSLFVAMDSGDVVIIIQKIAFVVPYCIGNFIIAVILLYSVIKKPSDVDDSNGAFVISLVATNLYPLLSMFINFHNPDGNVKIALFFMIMHVLVQIFYLLALVNLGLSLTVLPEARELRTAGIYSISRHPLYVSYIIMNCLNIFINQTLVYIPVMIICSYLQYRRARKEEGLLMKAFPEYVQYKKEVGFFGKKKRTGRAV